jgi:hypothetical protein
MVVLAFYSTVLAKIGSGPLWQKKVGVEVDRCVASWWANILYINNYVNTDQLVSIFGAQQNAPQLCASN